MQKRIIITGILAAVLIGGGVVSKSDSNPVLADSSSSSNLNPSILQVEPNKVLRGTWDLSVTGVKFYEGSQDPSKKAASIEMTIVNAAGRDKSFLPNGYIAALVGTSGKVYNSYMRESFEKSYNNAQPSFEKWAKEHAQVYYPGEFKMAEHLVVDSTEKNFTKVIYQDEKGQQVEVPIQGITPEIVKHNPDAK
ncbi:ASCH domain-containing protein [Desulfosporosinus fructosivorans]